MLHPEILQLFENIRLDRPLTSDIPPPRRHPEMLEAYVESLFLPILAEAEVVAKDASRACGWRPLFESLTFRGPKSRSALAEAALANAANITRCISDDDTAENTVLAFISGRQAPRVSLKLFEDLKALLRKHLNEEYDETSEATGWRLAVVGKVFPK